MVETDLIVVEPANPADLFKPESITNLVTQVREIADKHVPDLETPSGRKAIASLARKVASTKVVVDNIGKEYVAELKAMPKRVDEMRKSFRDQMDAIRDETRRPLTDWEAEQERIAQEKELQRQIDEAWVDAHTEYERREETARRERELAEREAEVKRQQEELDRKEKERLQREREAQIAQEAEEKARREAEAKLQQEREARERAEREKVEAESRAKAQAEAAVREAEQRAKEEADRKERERLEAEAKAKAERERHAANKRHQRKVQSDAIDAMAHLIEEFNCGFNIDYAGEIIKAIDDGKIPHVSLNY